MTVPQKLKYAAWNLKFVFITLLLIIIAGIVNPLTFWPNIAFPIGLLVVFATIYWLHTKLLHYSH